MSTAGGTRRRCHGRGVIALLRHRQRLWRIAGPRHQSGKFGLALAVRDNGGRARVGRGGESDRLNVAHGRGGRAPRLVGRAFLVDAALAAAKGRRVCHHCLRRPSAFVGRMCRLGDVVFLRLCSFVVCLLMNGGGEREMRPASDAAAACLRRRRLLLPRLHVLWLPGQWRATRRPFEVCLSERLVPSLAKLSHERLARRRRRQWCARHRRRRWRLRRWRTGGHRRAGSSSAERRWERGRRGRRGRRRRRCRLHVRGRNSGGAGKRRLLRHCRDGSCQRSCCDQWSCLHARRHLRARAHRARALIVRACDAWYVASYEAATLAAEEPAAAALALLLLLVLRRRGLARRLRAHRRWLLLLCHARAHLLHARPQLLDLLLHRRGPWGRPRLLGGGGGNCHSGRRGQRPRCVPRRLTQRFPLRLRLLGHRGQRRHRPARRSRLARSQVA